jgi:hypothetical protein
VPRKRPRATKSVRAVVLERTSAQTIRADREELDDLLRYEWDYYWELEYQRKQIEGDLLEALRQGASHDFRFDRWQRAVKYRYSLHPLSAAGVSALRG